MVSNLKSFIKKIIAFVLLVILLGVFLPIGIVKFEYKAKQYSEIDQIPSKKVGLVLGAAIWGKDKPSHALEDRLLSAVDLYKAGKIEKLIMSGDNGQKEYSEPMAMLNYVLTHNVEKEDVVLDFAGFRTYDSCYRLRDVFDQKEIVIITQDFHLPRALYICNSLGVDAVGYTADRRVLKDAIKNSFREFFASWLAWWEVNISKPEPKFLGSKEKVF